ncbi:MAG: BON domain-containing protein [Candidatus Acidiferrales bacterium]
MLTPQYKNKAARFAIAALLAGILLAFSAPAIGSIQPFQPLQQQTPVRPDVRSEQYLNREVGHVLALLPFYSVFDILQYSVQGYHVTLKGAVIHPTLKADAEAAVKKIEGVESVDNQIEVLPLSAADDQIRRAEFHAIYSQPNLNRYAQEAVLSIHIIVRNGQVALEGVVDSQGDKEAAGIAANTVPGVFSVTNNLVVQPGR